VDLTRDFLEAEGFEVLAAASGPAAVAALGRSRVDCVLLDVMLKGESGETSPRYFAVTYPSGRP
jgi:two-component system, OmpR family, response regulator